MIEQLQFSLRTAETPRLPSAWAYRIYGWLKNLPVWSSFLHRSRKRTTITAAIPCCTT